VYNRDAASHGGNMSGTTPAFADHLRRHLAALEAAGVRFVPKAGPPPELPAFEVPPEVEPEATPAEKKQIALAELAAEVAKCEKCPALFATRSRTVFGGGPVGAEVCFLGDAPREGDELFPGEVGDLLNRQLTAMGLGREEVYFAAAVKCRPPGRRQPKADELAHCRGHLERQLELVRPRAVCCFGPEASQSVLGSTAPLQQLRGKVHDWHGLPVVCTYHPAQVLDNPKLRGNVWDDLKMLMAAIGRPVVK
jgi:DNA polymerase